MEYNLSFIFKIEMKTNNKQNNNENDYLNTGNLCVVNKFMHLM